jgi:hypothetical protein
VPILQDLRADDVWFEADIRRVSENMTARFSDHYRSQVHPVFSLLTLGMTQFFRRLFNVDNFSAVRLTLATAAAMWMGLFFLFLRTIQCRKFDSIVFSAVAAVSSAAMFWAAVPESYVFGSATIVIVLAVTALSERRDIAPWADVAVAAAALSMLVTNFMFALVSLAARHRLKAAVQFAANALVVVVVLWAAQKLIAPSSHFFLGDREKLPHVDALSVPRVFFIHTLVMPDILSAPNEHSWLWPKLSVQHSAAWSLTRSGAIAVLAWLILLAAGAWAMVTLKSLKRFRLVLAVVIAGQLALHSIYGPESFLYTLNWLPLLVTVAAMSTLTRLRWISLSAAAVFIVSAAHHNYRELAFAFDALNAVSRGGS